MPVTDKCGLEGNLCTQLYKIKHPGGDEGGEDFPRRLLTNVTNYNSPPIHLKQCTAVNINYTVTNLGHIIQGIQDQSI